MSSPCAESLPPRPMPSKVFPEIGARMAADVLAREKAGEYAALTSAREFARAVTGVGVVPDVAVPAAKALEKAIELATVRSRL